MSDLRTLSNAKQKELRKLQKRKYRIKLNAFVVEGRRAVQQILENGKISVRWLLFDQDTQLWNDSVWGLHSKRVESYQIDRGSFVELTDTEHPQGILAVCDIPEPVDVASLLQNQEVRRIVVLDELQDPGNLGTIIRTAVWFGVDAIILGHGTVDPWNPKVIRSTAGATGALPLIQMSINELPTTDGIADWVCWRLEAAEDSISLKNAEIPDRLLLVIGNEGSGIRNLPPLPGVQSIVIDPAEGASDVESLNAGVAASITMFAIS